MNDFIEANNGTDLSHEALLLIKIQCKSCATKDEKCINFVPSTILTRYQSKYGNVQVDSDNVQNLEQGFFIDDDFVGFVFFYKAEEISAVHYISTDTLHIQLMFSQKTCQFQFKQDTTLDRGCEYFFERVCYNSSMYRYTLDVRNCQDEPWWWCLHHDSRLSK